MDLCILLTFFLSSFQDLIINKWIINKSWLFRHSTSKQGLHDAFDGWCLLRAPQGMYLSHSSSVWRDVYRLLNIQVELRVKLRNIKLSSKTFCEGILLERTWVVFNSYVFIWVWADVSSVLITLYYPTVLTAFSNVQLLSFATCAASL